MYAAYCFHSWSDGVLYVVIGFTHGPMVYYFVIIFQSQSHGLMVP